MPVIVLAVAMLAQSPDTPIDAAQLSRILGALRTGIDDVSLVFEGHWAGIKQGTPIEKMVSTSGTVYQGSYALRPTSPEHFYAALLDKYVENHAITTTNEQRVSYGILEGRWISVIGLPDEGEKVVSEMVGGPGSLDRPGSPERILFWWYFSTYTDLASRNYVYQGWEEVDGHRCLRFQVDSVPESKPQPTFYPVHRYWVDLERGGASASRGAPPK